MESLNTHRAVEGGLAEDKPIVTLTWSQTVAKYFEAALLIAGGIFVGAVLAILVGLFTGWIEISC